MKKAIALFSTLMVLVLVIILMSVALKNTTNIKQLSLQDRFLIQENLTINDVLALVDTQIASKIKNKSGKERVDLQKILFSSPLIIDNSVSNSTIEVNLIPNDGKLNINFLNTNELAIQNAFLSLFEKIGVKEPEILRDILLANITNSSKFRDDYKLPLKQLDKNFGYILSKEQFDEMLNLYVRDTNDLEAFNIKFEDYLSFYLNENDTYTSSHVAIDLNYAKLELIDAFALLPNSFRQNIKNNKLVYELPEKVELTEVQKNILDFKTKNIILKINTTSMNNKVEYLLNYNLEKKKISNISMDRWIY